MIRKLNLLICMVLIFSLMLTALASCGKDKNNQQDNTGGNVSGDTSGDLPNDTPDNSDDTNDEQKRVPVYQGMSISSVYSSTSILSYGNDKTEGGKVDFEYEKDNGNHNGHYKGDSEDDVPVVDDENPFPDNSANENIEEEIKSSLSVVGSPIDIYYATPGQDIYIYIHINNPDDFEIMSFTLNGKKYSSYMFEDGSDMQTIILKMNVGDVRGVIDYTIDAIKYIDGTEIKDVLIDGNKTVRAGVRVDGQVSATVSDLDIDTNAISFNVFVKDNDSLAATFGGSYKAIVYDGVKIVATKDLTVGDNSITFDGLKTNTVYQFAIVGFYDDLSGKGFGMNILYTDAIIADSVVLFSDITVGQESISFSFVWHEDHIGKSITAIKLYKDGKLASTLNGSTTTIGNLLSNNVYTIAAEYENGEETETIYLDFITATKAVPDFNINLTNVSDTSLAFGIDITDSDSVGAISSVKLVHGTEVTDLACLTNITLTDLLSSNEYTLKVTYTYDLNDGEGKHTVERELSAKTHSKETPEISIVNVSKTQTSVSFDIAETDYSNVGAITKIELIHKNGTIVADNLDVREFTNLLSDNEYTIKVTYVYDLNDGEGAHEIIKSASVTTIAKAAPNVTITNTEATQTLLGFATSVSDPDSIATINSVEVIHGEDVTTLEMLDSYSFDNLLSNNEYTLKITYSYNLNDGDGEHIEAAELSVNTVAKSTPTFTIANPTITTTTIKGSYTYSDADSILLSYKVELYDGDVLVEENLNKEIDFSSLSFNKDYVIRITYTYDANDGQGVVEAYEERIAKTYVDVSEFSVINTSAVSEGETIYVQIKLENPFNATVSSVVINGMEYEVMPASTTKKLFVEIVYNDQFDGGDTYLKVDNLNATLDGEAYTITSKNELSDNVFINGKVSVESLTLVNSDFIPFDDGSWVFPSEKVYVLITLNNPTGYVIDSFSNYTKIDDNRYYYEKSAWADWSSQDSISSITFHNEHISKTINFKSVTSNIHLYCVASDEIKYISTPDDLKNMNDCYYYELTNDIDLAGLEWQGGLFYGVFDGKGYSIKNMSFVGTVDNKNTHLGLFSIGSGFISNLNIKEATIIVESDHCYSGGLIAEIVNRTIINNCSIDEYSVFNINNSTSGFVGGLIGYIRHYDFTDSYNVTITNSNNNGSISGNYAGGLIGYAYSTTTIINSYNNGSVSGGCAGGLIGEVFAAITTINNSYNNGSVSGCSTGGFVGYVGASTITITNSYNNGSISTDTSYSCYVYAGGLIGYTYYSSIITITDSYNAGSVNASASNDYAYSGGLIGYSRDDFLVISNSFNSGKINATTQGNYAYTGSLNGSSGWSPDVTNSYSLNSGNDSENGALCTINQLNSREFYTETLGWSEDVWDFSDLDVENGKYPKLK